MKKSNEQLDDNPDRSNPAVSSILVDELDDLLIEVRDYVFNRAVTVEKPATDRNDALRDVASYLRTFACFLERENSSTESTKIEGMAKRCMLHSDSSLVQAGLASVSGTESKTLLAEYLDSLPFPHYEPLEGEPLEGEPLEGEPVEGEPSLIVQILEDGSRSIGRFVDRQFVAEKDASNSDD